MENSGMKPLLFCENITSIHRPVSESCFSGTE
jgi:hypothetical protein